MTMNPWVTFGIGVPVGALAIVAFIPTPSKPEMIKEKPISGISQTCWTVTKPTMMATTSLSTREYPYQECYSFIERK